MYIAVASFIENLLLVGHDEIAPWLSRYDSGGRLFFIRGVECVSLHFALPPSLINVFDWSGEGAEVACSAPARQTSAIETHGADVHSNTERTRFV